MLQLHDLAPGVFPHAKWLRESELKHCRIAMLASVGAFSAQYGLTIPGYTANVDPVTNLNAFVLDWPFGFTQVGTTVIYFHLTFQIFRLFHRYRRRLNLMLRIRSYQCSCYFSMLIALDETHQASDNSLIINTVVSYCHSVSLFVAPNLFPTSSKCSNENTK